MPETLGQPDVLHLHRVLEERGDVGGGEAGYAAADGGDEEGRLGMLARKVYKLIDVGTDGLSGPPCIVGMA